MNILYTNPNADLYGASRVLQRITKGIDTRKNTLIVVVPEDGPLVEILQKQEVTVKVIPYLSVIRRRVFRSWRILPFFLTVVPSVLHLWWLILKNRIDIVHTNTGVIFPSAIAAWLARKPHVWHLHEIFSEEFPTLWRYYGSFILRFSAKVLCVSTPIAKQFPFHPKVQVLHNGLDVDEFKPSSLEVDSLRQQYLDNRFSRLVGIVGRISPRKGQDVLLRSCALLKSQGYDDIRYLIVGDAFEGNEHLVSDLSRFAQEQNLTDDVLFIGFVPEPASLIAALDILVLPSILPEAFPTVVLEAMAVGVPVIATNVGGTVEQIENYVTGLLVPPQEPSALAEAIKVLMDDRVLREQIGSAGKQQIETRFNLRAMSKQLHTVYQDLMGKVS